MNDKEKTKPTHSKVCLVTKRELNKGHYPTEVYEFCERMRRWRADSWNSKTIIN